MAAGVAQVMVGVTCLMTTVKVFEVAGA